MERGKKAQLKIGETIFILIIFFILLAIGLIFYSNVQANSLSKIKEIELQREIMKSALAITHFPELSCTSLSGDIEEGCLDTYKLSVFSDIMGRSDSDPLKREMLLMYFEMFGNSEIMAINVFPGGRDEYVIFNKSIERYSSLKTYFVPVVLRDPIWDDNRFGYLKVKIYK